LFPWTVDLVHVRFHTHTRTHTVSVGSAFVTSVPLTTSQHPAFRVAFDDDVRLCRGRPYATQPAAVPMQGVAVAYATPMVGQPVVAAQAMPMQPATMPVAVATAMPYKPA
jgi:outer membrane receptor for Fe3+-dicitrate